MTIIGMVAILGTVCFDHLGEGNLPRDGDHPKNGDHHRGGDHHRDGGCLRDFYHPKGWLLNFGSVESSLSTKNRNLKSVTLSVCLSVCLFVCYQVGL